MKILGYSKKIYKFLAYSLLNTILIFIIINIILGTVYFVKDQSSKFLSLKQTSYISGDKLFSEDGKPLGIGKRYPEEFKYFDFNACREIGEQYAAEVLDDFYKLDQEGFIYSPWVQFAHPPFNGKKVTIETGKMGKTRRRTLNLQINPDLPVVRIFTFGGSTTFGFWVSDEHTWPTFLSQILNERAVQEDKPFRIEVLNYGRNGYTPSQETALLITLLKSGHKPSLAIFLEGLNWGEDEDVPGFTDQAEKLFLAGQFYDAVEVQASSFKYEWLPLDRLIHSLQVRFGEHKSKNKIYPSNLQTESSYDKEKRMLFVTNRFKRNKKLIKLLASGFDLKTLFFLQPNVSYGYNLQLLRDDLRKGFGQDPDTPILYNNLRNDKDYIDLSNLFKFYGNDKKALIDGCHYAPAFNKFLAEQIAQHIDLDGLKVFPSVRDESKVTGAPLKSLTRQKLKQMLN